MTRHITHMLLLLAAALLVGCIGDTTSQEHLEQARTLAEAGESVPAIRELKVSISKDMHNLEARALLGEVYYNTRDYPGAEKELTRVLESDDPAYRAQIVPLLALTLIQLRDYSRIDDLDIQDLDSEGRSITLAAKGLARLFQGDEPAALELIGTAISIKPPPPFARLARARVDMAQGNYESALQKLINLQKQHKDYLPAWNLRGDILAALKMAPNAEAAYTRALKISPKAFDARLNRAMMRIYQRKFKEARSDLNELVKLHRGAASQHPGVSFAFGIVNLQGGNYTAARKAFEKATEVSFAYPLSYYYMAIIDMEQGSFERALGEVYRFMALAPGSVAGPKLAARLELEHDGFHAAEELLEPLIEKYPSDIEALNLLATAKLGLSKGGDAVALLERVVALAPESPGASTRLSAGYLTMGEVELGIALLEKTLDQNPTFERADILLVLNFLQEGKVEEAISAAQDYRDRHPDSTTSYNLLGRAHMAADNMNEAYMAFNRVLKLDLTDIAARQGLADMALSAGKLDAARDYYQQILKYNENDMDTQLKLAATYAREGNEEVMLTMLQIAIDDHPEAIEPLLVLIRYHMAAGELHKAQPVIEQLELLERNQPDALATLASYQLATNSYNQAMISLERLTTARPGVAQYHFMLAKAYAGLNDAERSRSELGLALELEPDHFYGQIALARLTLISEDFGQFDKELVELKKVAPRNADVMQLEVAQSRRLGNAEKVTWLLNVLYEQLPNSENLRALAQDHMDHGRGEDGAMMLSRWLNDYPDDVVVRLSLAQMYGDMGRHAQARRQYETVLSIDHDNVVALNNLSWSLLDVDPELALRHAQQAYEIAPHSSAVLDTLAMAQLQNGMSKEAKRTLDRALEMKPNDPELRFHEAKIMHAEGMVDAARETLYLVLSQNGDFAHKDEVRAMLKRLQSEVPPG